MSFTGGKLKLKGSAPPGIGKKKKKKQRAQESNELALVEGEQSDGQKEDAGEHGKVRKCIALSRRYWMRCRSSSC